MTSIKSDWWNACRSYPVTAIKHQGTAMLVRRTSYKRHLKYKYIGKSSTWRVLRKSSTRFPRGIIPVHNSTTVYKSFISKITCKSNSYSKFFITLKTWYTGNLWNCERGKSTLRHIILSYDRVKSLNTNFLWASVGYVIIACMSKVSFAIKNYKEMFIS